MLTEILGMAFLSCRGETTKYTKYTKKSWLCVALNTVGRRTTKYTKALLCSVDRDDGGDVLRAVHAK